MRCRNSLLQRQDLEMADKKEPSSDNHNTSSTEKRIKQTISVPFCWEERPGTPIKNWKPTIFTTPPHPQPQLTTTKFIASIPFQWEEKPGTPLPCFLEPPTVFHVSSPMNPFLDDNTNRYVDDDDEILSESESDDSFNTADSLLGNGGISSESDISSYGVTGMTNLVGASLLEWLFPLLTPPRSEETVVSDVQVKSQKMEMEIGKKRGVSTRKTLTLGELIMISRRQSFHRKAIKMQTQNLSKGDEEWKGFSFCVFGGSKILSKINMDWKRQLQLKMM